MTFREAVEKLRGLSEGVYRTLDYEYRIDSDGKEHHNCQIYVSYAISNVSFFNGKTWEEAFSAYDEAAMKMKRDTADLVGAPAEDIAPPAVPIPAPAPKEESDVPF